MSFFFLFIYTKSPFMHEKVGVSSEPSETPHPHRPSSHALDEDDEHPVYSNFDELDEVHQMMNAEA
jgi:hypothetical protein